MILSKVVALICSYKSVYNTIYQFKFKLKLKSNPISKIYLIQIKNNNDNHIYPIKIMLFIYIF